VSPLWFTLYACVGLGDRRTFRVARGLDSAGRLSSASTAPRVPRMAQNIDWVVKKVHMSQYISKAAPAIEAPAARPKARNQGCGERASLIACASPASITATNATAPGIPASAARSK
jgi:hypothetical protein